MILHAKRSVPVYLADSTFPGYAVHHPTPPTPLPSFHVRQPPSAASQADQRTEQQIIKTETENDPPFRPPPPVPVLPTSLPSESKSTYGEGVERSELSLTQIHTRTHHNANNTNTTPDREHQQRKIKFVGKGTYRLFCIPLTAAAREVPLREAPVRPRQDARWGA